MTMQRKARAFESGQAMLLPYDWSYPMRPIVFFHHALPLIQL